MVNPKVVPASPAPKRGKKAPVEGVRKPLTKAERAKRGAKRQRVLLARAYMAQKYSDLNVLPRSLPAREFKFNLKDRPGSKIASKVASKALAALREIMQINAVKVLQRVSEDMLKTGKAQVSKDAVRAAAYALGFDKEKPERATVLTAQGTGFRTAR